MRYLVFLLLTHHCLFGQGQESYLHNRMVLERAALQSGSTNVTFSPASAPPGMVGDVFLNHDFRPSKFILFVDDKVVTGYAARLDLRRNEFDIMTEQGIRALAGSRVKSLEWSDSLTKQPQFFVNASRFNNEDGIPYLGFFQILAEGKLVLLRKTELIFKEADRSPHHNAGNADHRFLKRSALYYVEGDCSLKLPGKRNLLKLFAGKDEEMSKFIKINALDLNQDSHIAALFEYYNLLVNKSMAE